MHFTHLLHNYVFSLCKFIQRDLLSSIRLLRQTNVESFHAALLRFIKPHPKVYEFIGTV